MVSAIRFHYVLDVKIFQRNFSNMLRMRISSNIWD